MTTTDTVVFDRVTRRYGDARAVADVTLTLRPGETAALLGPNARPSAPEPRTHTGRPVRTVEGVSVRRAGTARRRARPGERRDGDACPRHHGRGRPRGTAGRARPAGGVPAGDGCRRVGWRGPPGLARRRLRRYGTGGGRGFS
ncbi:hypothetical protein GCM10018789_26150 [Streptomyces werraensis]|nr:hypothetical protein GCM10018789_26150 [Streptomyces werraensis]